MTRSRRFSMQGDKTQDRHLQRNGGQVKPPLKKGGSGRGNWGSIYEALWSGDLNDGLDHRQEWMKVQTMPSEQFWLAKMSTKGYY